MKKLTIKRLLSSILLLLSFISLSFAEDKGIIEKHREVSINSTQNFETQFQILPKNIKDIAPFDFKTFIHDKKKFENFIISNIQIFEISSPKEVEGILKKGTEKLFFHGYFKETPLISTFIYRSMKKPESVAKFSSMFLQFNKLIIFSALMLFSFIFSHLLGEYKFNYDVLSVPRILFAFFRVGLINLFRLGCFGVLFSRHTSPIIQVYSESVASLSADYPVLSFVMGIIS